MQKWMVLDWQAVGTPWAAAADDASFPHWCGTRIRWISSSNDFNLFSIGSVKQIINFRVEELNTNKISNLTVLGARSSLSTYSGVYNYSFLFKFSGYSGYQPVPLSRSLPIGHFRKDWQKLSQLSWNNFTQLCRQTHKCFIFQLQLHSTKDNMILDLIDLFDRKSLFDNWLHIFV